MSTDQTPQPPSDRVRVRRVAERGSYDPAAVQAVLDEAYISHVGVPTDDGPLVLPMLHAHDGEYLYLHGAAGNHLLKSGQDMEICATVTIVDGLVYARSAFHHSMNYRSVVVRGNARLVTDPEEKDHALRLLTDRVGEGRYEDSRQPDAVELKKTRVLAVPLTEASLKVRAEMANDLEEDLPLPYWAGVVPITSVIGDPIDNPDLDDGIAAPGYLPR